MRFRRARGFLAAPGQEQHPLHCCALFPSKTQVALYYASAVPSLGDHLAAGVPPEKAGVLRAQLGPPPGPPIKSLPAAGVGDAADGVGAAHLATGAGTATFAVDNLRWPVVVALQTSKWNLLSVEAVTGPISFSEPDAPQQVLVGAGPAPGTATVRWATAGADGRAAPRLRWGWAPGSLSAGDVAASTFSYGAADMCGADAVAGFSDPGALHSAVIEWAAQAQAQAQAPQAQAGGKNATNATTSPAALARARRRIHYELYDAARPATPTFKGSFLPLAPGGPGSKARIAFAADVGQAEPDGSARAGWQFAASRNTSRALAAEVRPTGFAATAVVIGGDVAYANGHGPVWDAFFNQFQPAFSAAPTIFATGNHEVLWPVSAGGSATGDRYGNLTDSGGECGVPFAVRTGGGSGSPGPPDGDGSGRANPPWFSVDDGPVHLHVFSTEHPFEPGTPQHVWIEADLKGVDRTLTPWLIVVGHRPIYLASAYPGGGNASDAAVAVDLATHLEPLWLGAGVDLTLSGHHHSYQRTCAMAGRGRCADGRSAAGAAGYGSTSPPIPALADLKDLPRPANGGPIHVVAGIGGGDLTDNAMPWPTPAGWDALSFQHGYVRLSADAQTLALTAVRSADGSVLDAFELRKGEPGVVHTLGGAGVAAAPDVAAASVGGT
jgi:acid phosphatase type 7